MLFNGRNHRHHDQPLPQNRLNSLFFPVSFPNCQLQRVKLDLSDGVRPVSLPGQCDFEKEKVPTQNFDSLHAPLQCGSRILGTIFIYGISVQSRGTDNFDPEQITWSSHKPLPITASSQYRIGCARNIFGRNMCALPFHESPGPLI